MSTPTVHVPDCSAATRTWCYAYEKREACRVFRNALNPLAREVQALLHDAPTGGKGLTFAALGRIPQPAQDFYSDLIEASEALEELREDDMEDRVMERHPVLLLIGSPLGAFDDRRVRHHLAKCRCLPCREALAQSRAEGADE
ncbi:hypothetical protein [Streptomyces sp. NPDC051098]|uniref:hypothetical protein n=1 Tax=Streptomyces sp. NPDC051098 TaxID=3155411 RepID=UPI00341AE75B